MMIFTSNPYDYEQFNKETNGYTQSTAFKVEPIYSNNSFNIESYRIINRKKVTISKEINNLSELHSKVILITLFNDDDFLFFSDLKDSLNLTSNIDDSTTNAYYGLTDGN